MKKKIIICGVIILIIIALCLCAIFIKPKEQSPVVNNQNQIETNAGNSNQIQDVVEEKLDITKQMGDMTFSNFEIVKTKEERKKVRAQILNTSDEIIEKKTVKLIMTCADGRVKETAMFILSALPNETIKAETVVGIDVKNIVDVKIENFE